jgi:hypothetical protein
VEVEEEEDEEDEVEEEEEEEGAEVNPFSLTCMPCMVNVCPAYIHNACDIVCIKASLNEVVIIWPVTTLPKFNPYVIIIEDINEKF